MLDYQNVFIAMATGWENKGTNTYRNIKSTNQTRNFEMKFRDVMMKNKLSRYKREVIVIEGGERENTHLSK